jgi:hypothetical protein
MTTAAGDALSHVVSLPLHKSDFGTPGRGRSAPRRSGELPCVIFPERNACRQPFHYRIT